jgi:hypothetical protein
MHYVSILDVAKARGVKESETGGISLGEFERVGLPLFCGCSCTASLAAYNAYPTTAGHTMCEGCVKGSEKGFLSVEAFEAWCVYTDAVAQAEAIESVASDVSMELADELKRRELGIPSWDYGRASASASECDAARERLKSSATWAAYVVRFKAGETSLCLADIVDAILSE